jgi:phosphoglycolate phosphatase-like HAD superfamily hydrolase
MENPEIDNRYPLDRALEEAEEVKHVLKRRRADKKPNVVDYQEAEDKVKRIGLKDGKFENKEIESKEIGDLFDVVLFDWDGVLFDSMESIARYAQEVCRLLGKEIDTKEFLESYDQPFWNYYTKQGIACDTSEQRDYIYHLYHDQVGPILEKDPQIKKSDLFPDAMEAIRKLESLGLKVGIVSAHKPEEIKALLEKNGIKVDYLIGLAHNKSQEIKRLCESEGFDSSRVLMIGDLPSDLRDGQRAGVKVMAMARFPEAEDRLGSYDPDYLATSLGIDLFKLKKFQDNK